MYTIHGSKNENFVPLLHAFLSYRKKQRLLSKWGYNNDINLNGENEMTAKPLIWIEDIIFSILLRPYQTVLLNDYTSLTFRVAKPSSPYIILIRWLVVRLMLSLRRHEILGRGLPQIRQVNTAVLDAFTTALVRG